MLKAAVQALPGEAGIKMANWNWKVVCQYVSGRFGINLSRGSCLNYSHRLGFVLKRPKKRLVKADEAKRETFAAEYAALWDEAHRSGGKIFFADEAHFRADAEPRGEWVLKGEPALADSTSPRYGEKAGYYSAVRLETGEVEWMDLEGNSNAGTSAAFLKQLRERHCGRLHVVRDNAPAHRGEAMREYLRTPGLGLRLVNPRFHEGRLCQATARSSMAMRQSGAGRGKRQRETRAWEPGRRYRRGSGTSSTGCPAGKMRSSVAAAPSRNQWPKGFHENPSLVPDVPQMHLPLWLWFSTQSSLVLKVSSVIDW